MQKDFLLNTQTGRILYERVKELPIIDYHNHLSLTDIAMDKRFDDIYELWVQPDPYKHRAMRSCGVDEYYITGNAPREEKFKKWCETIPKLQLNPLSHWAYMELDSLFGITEYIDGQNAEKLYAFCNAYLRDNVVSVSSLLKKYNAEYISPCVSLVDDIHCFGAGERCAPSLRGDDMMALTETFLSKLSALTNIEIDSLESLEQAICSRLDTFASCNCRFSDHALDNGFAFFEDDGKNAERFADLLENKLSNEEKEKLQSYLLVFLSSQYAKRNIVMQLHIGAQRYTSSRLRRIAGPAGGFAGIGNSVDILSLTSFLDAVEGTEYGLPKTLLFTLNPADNALISTLSGSYAKSGVNGLITQGPAWWWCDHKQGIVTMLEHAASFGVLSNFLGMTTDSRSFLSFIRHDYFRRILCDWLGEKWEKGEILCDLQSLENLAYQLCYGNVKQIV